MEQTDVRVATVVAMLWPLSLLLFVCVEADRGRWLTVADGDDGADSRAGDAVSVATVAAVVCAHRLREMADGG